MSFRSIKKGFSLTETIIMLTILAIAVASLTPMITKKLANNVEAGTTINGVSHGRYEIYAKEIVEFGSKAYEKSGRETKRAEASVLVFDRLDDLTYKKYASKSPEMNSKGQKSTLYEQIDNAKAYRSPSGDIEYVEFKKNGITKKYPVGGNIIVESSNVIYTEGKIIPGNPDSFEKKSGGIVLPNDNNRIIEGALTKKFNKKSDDNNILWHIDAKNDNADNFEGTVTVIPWEKVISGNKTIVDKPIKKDPITGEYIGTFDPGLGTKSLVLHAVGGGGAGGGLSNIGGAVTPKNATAEELKYMKEILAKRFREIATKNGLSHEANIPIDTLVRIERTTGHLHDKQYDDVFPNDDNYIVLNTVDGTITVKADTRNGLIFPSDLLDYTNILGSQTQETDLYDMPIWGNFKTFETGGDRGKPFYAGAVGCGCGGGKGTTYKIDSSGKHFNKKWAIYCPAMDEIDGGIVIGGCDGICYWDQDEKGHSYPVHGKYAKRKCACSCDGTYYPNIPECGAHKGPCTCASNPGGAPACNVSHCQNATGATCHHEMRAGIPGSAPACGVACTKVEAPIWQVETQCDNLGCPGGSQSQNSIVPLDNIVSVDMGRNGRSCFMHAGNHSAASIGGTGSHPCYSYSSDINYGGGIATGGASSVSHQGKTAFNDTLTFVSAIVGVTGKGLTGTADLCISLSDAIRTQNLAGSTPLGDSSALAGLKSDITTYVNNAMDKKGAMKTMYGLNAALHTMEQNAANNSLSIKADSVKIVAGQLRGFAAEAANGYLKGLGLNATCVFPADGSLPHFIGPDAAKAAALAGSEGLYMEPVVTLTTYPADENMAGLTPSCGSSVQCGANGVSGQAHNDCADETGIDVSENGHGKRFNHIYSWTTPFAINQLHYGEAGQPGEYKTTKIAETTGPFTIILGLGGVWTDHKDTINGKWAKGVSGQAKRGLDGTDTIIKMKDRNVLTAKGGKGGTQSLSTHRYDLCYAKKDECKRTDASVTCCDNEIGKRSTKEIFTTASKMSAFENIKALTGNSTIIGIGLGRGGEGAGTRAGVEQLKGLRVFRNASGHNISYSDSQIKKEEGTYKADLANLDAFKNYALAPSGLNFKGGDGAVIITW